MPASATISFTASVTGLPSGSKTISIPVTVAAPVDASVVQNLVSGANTIVPPVGATNVVIIPPAGNVVTLTLKGITGDTGVPLSPTNPSWISLVAVPGSFVLTTNAILNGMEFLYF